MSANPYAPPAAVVDDVAPYSPAVRTPAFFAVSVTKLIVLSICTMGLYGLFWFYKNWRLIRQREQSDILPGARAFFAVLFCYACFSRIRESGQKAGIEPGLPAGPLAAGWILTTMTWRLPEPYWMLAFLAIIFLVPVQAYANRVNAALAPGHDPNRRFTKWNWLAVAIGVPMFLLLLIGLFLPAQ